jgi:hypothetical protein
VGQWPIVGVLNPYGKSYFVAIPFQGFPKTAFITGVNVSGEQLIIYRHTL